MTTTAPPLLRRHVVTFAVRHAGSPDLRAALLADLDNRELNDTDRHLAAWCFSVQTRPAMGNHLAAHLLAVADAQHDVEMERKSFCTCHHEDRRCQREISWAEDCAACDEHWNELLDDAIRQLFYVLGDEARLDLAAVSA